MLKHGMTGMDLCAWAWSSAPLCELRQGYQYVQKVSRGRGLGGGLGPKHAQAGSQQTDSGSLTIIEYYY